MNCATATAGAVRSRRYAGLPALPPRCAQITSPVVLPAHPLRIGTSALGQALQIVRVARLSSGGCEAEEHDDRSCESGHVIVGQSADPFAELRPLDRGDLVDHEAARLADPVLLIGFNRYSKQWSIGLVGGARTNRDRRGCIEEIVVDDDDGAVCRRSRCPQRRSDLALVSLVVAECVDESLIIGLEVAGRNGERLIVRLLREEGRSNVGHPELNRAQALCTKPLAMSVHADGTRSSRTLTNHAAMFHVTVSSTQQVSRRLDESAQSIRGHNSLRPLAIGTSIATPARYQRGRLRFLSVGEQADDIDVIAADEVEPAAREVRMRRTRRPRCRRPRRCVAIRRRASVQSHQAL